MGYSDRVFERFAECPGIIEIRWISDDPDYHRASEDMFHCQEQGIPEEYGKKDKRTTEQANFYCCVCECPSASIKTLRAHCEGTQHKRKAEQAFQQYQYRERMNKTSLHDTTRDATVRLKDVLREKNDYEIVGLQFVEEYRTRDRNDIPIYMCSLRGCKRDNSEFYGNADQTFEHLKSESHGWSYFCRLYGNEFFPDDYVYEDVFQDVIKQERKYRYREYCSDNMKDYESVKIGHRPDSSYIRELVQSEKEKHEPLIPLPQRRRIDDPRRNEENRVDENVGNVIGSNGFNQKRRLNEEYSNGNRSKAARVSTENLLSLPSHLQIPVAQPDLSLVDDTQTSTMNIENHHDLHSSQVERAKQESQKDVNGNSISSKAPPQESDFVKKFNLEVAHWIMYCMNRYYQYDNNRETCERKIKDANEYQELARSFSRKYRKLEKESYISENRTLDGLELNLDMKDRLKMEIDIFFEKRERIPLD